MATYVNDLRLKEIATGDEAGTWGTSTNTNLELIAEAMGHGAEAVANASTHTITMADGATDQFRSTFLRLTGGGQACTVTLAPNTLSHTWIMRNETAAVLTLTQGSGANVAIAAGQTKIVATDGAGSGAIVYEMDDLELAGNLAVGGTLVSTGKITADAGIDIDNINIDGTTIALSSGDLTLDAAGKIILDGDEAGATVHLKDGGVHWGSIYRSSSNFNIKSETQDKDIVFLGNDGGSEITALTLDMSDAGAATFNSTGTFAGGNANFTNDADVVTLNGSLHTRLLIDTSSTGGHQAALVLESNGTQSIIGNTGSGTSISVATGNLTLDVAGDIILDADGADVIFKDGGTAVAEINLTGGNLILNCLTSDEDFLVKGNDGGSTIDALVLDMSAAGFATFNNGIKAGRDISAYGANTGSVANRMALSMEGSGVSRIICNGADGSTNGTFEVFTANSGGTGSVKLGVDVSGNLLVNATAAINSSHTFAKNHANNVLVCDNQLSSGNPFGVQVRFTGQDPNNTTSLFYGAYGKSSGSLVARFLVRSNGGIANFQSNDANLSDERVKRDISPLDSMWDKFKALEIVNFKYKDQTHDNANIGVIAQQVESVAPEFVSNEGFGETPEGEDPLKTIYTADLYHATIKALQEAMERIETLEAKVQELENK